MDVVYPYRRSWGDEFELRYSLRSLANLPHERVIIAGDRPRFVWKALVCISTPRQLNRFKSSTANIVAAVRQAGISGRFVAMNDDIFVLKPWQYRREHRCTIDEYLADGPKSGPYRQMLIKTKELLAGIDEPLFHGLHTPMVYEAGKLLELVERFAGQSYLLRTLYGNLYQEPSVRRDDVKAHAWPFDMAEDFLSTSDICARNPDCRAWLKARFPQPSIYEKWT